MTGYDLLVANEFSVTYARQSRPAVNRLSFTIQSEQIIGVTGESGCGKTTLGWGVMGVLPSDARVSGSLLYRGAEIFASGGMSARVHRANEVTMIFQEPRVALNPLIRVGSQVMELARITEREARRALEEMGLEEHRFFRSYPHQLSGGECQRILIALALTRNSRLIIADEPGTALNEDLRLRVLDLLMRRARERGASILLISHDTEMLARYADEILVLDHGRMAAHGKSSETLGAVELPKRH